MKYYKLTGNSTPQIIGVRNGVHQGKIIWKNFESNKSEKKILNYFIKKLGKSLDSIEPIDFEIEYVEAYKSAKMTDFFTFTPALYGIIFFVTDRVVKVFKEFELPLHTFIPVNVYHKQVEYKYWAFYIPQFYSGDQVAFNKSIFNKGSRFQKENITFKNYEEYMKAGYVSVEKLVFNNMIDESLDLFVSGFIGYSYFVTEKLKMALENIMVTGVDIGIPVHPEIDFE